MDRILLRFNTKFLEDPSQRKWRVLVNGEEQLAHQIEVRVPCETITEPISTGEIKHHFLCHGYLHWEADFVVKILDYPSHLTMLRDAAAYDAEPVLSQIEFTEPEYFRKQIYKDSRLEIVLACFKRGQQSPLHSHGKSNCAIRCLKGSISHVSNGYQLTLDKGAVHFVNPGHWHEVTSTSDETVLLNFYSPPLEG